MSSPSTHDAPSEVAEPKVLDPSELRKAVLAINAWPPNVPLLLVFSAQKKKVTDVVDGGAAAVRSVYDRLFCLESVGIADDARSHYLHICHEGAETYPYAIRKPTKNYGKTHQRIIKDTFGQQFLERVSEGKYKIASDFPSKVLSYLKLDAPLDVKPLVLFHYWNAIGNARSVGDLWKRFSLEFGLDKEPYSEVFTCSALEELLPLVSRSSVSSLAIKQIVLPDEYGVGSYSADFWLRFRSILQGQLKSMGWQGNVADLVNQVTSALMHDQAIFLLGAPGTGKTTVVREAILPSLRKACGSEISVRFSYQTLTPSTSSADLFGFQGLDGNWIEGPLISDLLVPYVETTEEASDEGTIVDGELAAPRVLFLDEANRIDIEGVLSPLQAAFDSLQKRQEPPLVTLGKSTYLVPKRVWRIFAGNSPAADTGRREQSRPFKRRLVTIIPPDPIDTALRSESTFQRLCLELLEKASASDEAEISEPAAALFGAYSKNPSPLEDLRLLLECVHGLKRVAVTVGLVESILLRAACTRALGAEGALDSSATGSLLGLIAGDRGQIDRVIKACDENHFPELKKALESSVLANHSEMSTEIDPIL
jgi:MoxR-like ATPase